MPEIARDVPQVLGRRCVDLLSGSPCQPLAAAEGGIELKGATLRQVWSGAQLEELLAAASAARATQALRPARQRVNVRCPRGASQVGLVWPDCFDRRRPAQTRRRLARTWRVSSVPTAPPVPGLSSRPQLRAGPLHTPLSASRSSRSTSRPTKVLCPRLPPTAPPRPAVPPTPPSRWRAAARRPSHTRSCEQALLPLRGRRRRCGSAGEGVLLRRDLRRGASPSSTAPARSGLPTRRRTAGSGSLRWWGGLWCVLRRSAASTQKHRLRCARSPCIHAAL